MKFTKSTMKLSEYSKLAPLQKLGYMPTPHSLEEN